MRRHRSTGHKHLWARRWWLAPGSVVTLARCQRRPPWPTIHAVFLRSDVAGLELRNDGGNGCRDLDVQPCFKRAMLVVVFVVAARQVLHVSTGGAASSVRAGSQSDGCSRNGLDRRQFRFSQGSARSSAVRGLRGFQRPRAVGVAAEYLAAQRLRLGWAADAVNIGVAVECRELCGRERGGHADGTAHKNRGEQSGLCRIQSVGKGG